MYWTREGKGDMDSQQSLLYSFTQCALNFLSKSLYLLLVIFGDHRFNLVTLYIFPFF